MAAADMAPHYNRNTNETTPKYRSIIGLPSNFMPCSHNPLFAGRRVGLGRKREALTIPRAPDWPRKLWKGDQRGPGSPGAPCTTTYKTN